MIIRMRLSVVFELLLVFLFLAFASARVIDPKNTTKNVTKVIKKTTTVRQGPPNRYCACTSRMCNCCRDFSLPVVPIKGPGCASIMYLQKDTMMVTMQFGDRVLSNTTITGKNPRPICMALPGGISQFCGRIYGISRKGDQFRACLGLELRALDDIEAALRVSCFKFGPKGVNLESAPPVPAESTTGNKEPDTDDDDDDYDLEDDDDDDDLIGLVDDEDDGASNEDNEVDSDSDSVDYTGFSVLGEDILGSFFSDDSSSSSKKKKVNKKTAKPQAVTLKASTTRRPVLPIRRRSTTKPETITKRPVNRITRPTKPVKQRPISLRPQNVAQPSPQKPTAVSPQISVHQVHTATSLPLTSTVNYVKDIITKQPTMETSITTMSAMESHEKEKEHSTNSVKITTVATEAPITFTMTTHATEASSTSNNVKNEIKIPQTDLAKVEAVAAIAQQDVTSGVISSSSLTSEKTEKPEDLVTISYEKISSFTTEHTTPYMPEITEKISSVNHVPASVNTISSSQGEITHMHNSLDKLVNNELGGSSHTHGIKHKVTTIYQSTTEINSEEEGSNENSDEDEIEDEEENDETDQEEEEEEEEEENDEKESSVNQQIEQNLIRKKHNYTIILQKQPVNSQNNKLTEVEDDLLSEVLSDEDEETDVDNNKNKPIKISIKKPINKNKITNNEEESEEDEDTSDSVESHKEVKPTKLSNNEKPDPEKSDEDDDDDDILEVLEEDDDDDDEDSDDDDDDDDEDEDEEKNKKKKVTQNSQVIAQSTTQPTLIKVKKPIIQTTQNFEIQRPGATVTTTEKFFIYNEPERVPEKVIIHNKPVEKVTEKVILYKEPINKFTENVVYQHSNPAVTDKVSIHKEPVNLIYTKSPQEVVYHKEPTGTVSNKFVIYKEPMTQQVVQKVTEQIMGKPVFINNKETHNFEINKESVFKFGEKENENDEEESSEEESDDNGELVASIIKPGFSNKYAEEHDLADSDDLDIEDSEDEGNDFEEDRKLKQKTKKAVVKNSSSNMKPVINNNSFKVLGLSELIGERKKFHSQLENKPISSSRTHRRMNLDKLVSL